MKKGWSGCVIVLLFLICTGLTQGAGPKPYWNRLEGFPNQVEILEITKEYYFPYAEIQVNVPQIYGVGDEKWQAQFNTELAATVEGFIEEILEIASEVHTEYGDGTIMPYSGIVDYELKLNQGGLLSLIITYYSYTGGAHGMTFVDYLNFDLTTGRRLQFRDLFTTPEDLDRAVNVINQAISEEPAWFFIDEFSKGLFEEDQDFYLGTEGVNICFGLYAIAPYAAGIQEFLISLPE